MGPTLVYTHEITPARHTVSVNKCHMPTILPSVPALPCHNVLQNSQILSRSMTDDSSLEVRIYRILQQYHNHKLIDPLLDDYSLLSHQGTGREGNIEGSTR